MKLAEYARTWPAALLLAVSVFVAVPGCRKKTGDSLPGGMTLAHNGLEAWLTLTGEYPAGGNEFYQVTSVLVNNCKELDVLLIYRRSEDRLSYTLIVSPKDMSNEALGAGRDGRARVYMIKPRGLFQAYLDDESQLPVKDEESVQWEFVAEWSTAPATQPEN